MNEKNKYDEAARGQIEEIAKVIKSSLDGLGCGNFNFTGYEISTMFAEALYNAGYCKQEWISVDERLPELYKDVITYDMSIGVGIDSVLSNGEFVLGRRVTHWMPLPELPKMKRKEDEGK